MVFNLDGRVPDDGSVMEAAVGWTAGLPVVIYKTTPITMLGGHDNPMVAGLSMRWTDVDDVADLPKAVAAAVALDKRLGGPRYQPGAHAQRVVALGRKVWRRMPEIHAIARLDPPQMEAAAQKLMRGSAPSSTPRAERSPHSRPATATTTTAFWGRICAAASSVIASGAVDSFVAGVCTVQGLAGSVLRLSAAASRSAGL